MRLSTYQAVYESHAQSVGSLVQFHYKHHTQVIRKGGDAGGGYREREFTPTNTPCRGHRHPKAQNTHRHTQGLAMGLDKQEKKKTCCAEETRGYSDTCKGAASIPHTHASACRGHTHYTVKGINCCTHFKSAFFVMPFQCSYTAVLN